MDGWMDGFHVARRILYSRILQTSTWLSRGRDSFYLTLPSFRRTRRFFFPKHPSNTHTHTSIVYFSTHPSPSSLSLWIPIIFFALLRSCPAARLLSQLLVSTHAPCFLSPLSLSLSP
ncbi:hypothetical protein CTA2_1162 [Colletotrichum tanaceti]|nr:hypothetical protein CTA2_1162 [Colletotrichum tanaceti]